MSILSMRIGRQAAGGKHTYGWARAEIMGTLMSISFLLAITIWLCHEATGRIKNPEDIDENIMLITAVIGLFFNLIQMSILHGDHGHGDHDHGHGGHHHHHEGGDDENKKYSDVHDHSHGHSHGHSHDHGKSELNKSQSQRNINVQAAFLHVLGDLLMSVGVIVAAVIIWFKPEWKIADPLCTYLFSLIVCVTVFPTLKSCLSVLMEVAPAECDVEAIKRDIENLSAVVEIHEFHLWSISVGKLSLSVHVETREPLKALKQVTEMLEEKYQIDHATVQCEDNSQNNEDTFACHQTAHLD